MVYCKNYFEIAKIFLLRLFKIAENQSAPGLNRDLSRNFLWLRSANHVKFTDEWMIYKEKLVLIKNMFTNGLNMSLPQWAWVKKTVSGVETHSLVKKKFTGAVVSKGHAESLLWHESLYHYWVPYKLLPFVNLSKIHHISWMKFILLLYLSISLSIYIYICRWSSCL